MPKYVKFVLSLQILEHFLICYASHMMPSSIFQYKLFFCDINLFLNLAIWTHKDQSTDSNKFF